jgi:hypothetical protein
LQHTNWRLFEASSLEEVRRLINAERISVVIWEYEFCATHWKQLCDEFCLGGDGPKFIISSPLATDGIWAEALSLGAQDVLLTPFDQKEVYWVVSHSHLAWQTTPAAGPAT